MLRLMVLYTRIPRRYKYRGGSRGRVQGVRGGGGGGGAPPPPPPP